MTTAAKGRGARRVACARSVRPVLLGGACAGALVVLGGCEADSFLDPSVIGRWEHTPTVVPILERISAIEDGGDMNVVPTSQVQPEDLIPEPDVYRVGAGDELEVRIQDLYYEGREEGFLRVVDQRGFIDLPRAGSIAVYGRTAEEIQEAIAASLRERDILADPIVAVTATSQRGLTFNIVGWAENPGLFVIPRPDYRLLEALATAGRFTTGGGRIYVIRQTVLTERTAAQTPEGARPTPARPAAPQGEDILDLIDELSRPREPQQRRPSPAMLGRQNGTGGSRQPERAGTGGPGGSEPPPIDLDGPVPAPERPAVPRTGTESPTSWIFVNGEWVQGPRAEGEASPEAEPVAAEDGGAQVTQRVIEIPTDPLLQGDARYNIVIRPGDVIRVPQQGEGNFYMAGEVNRPGVYGFPFAGRMTLMRAIDAAGGTSVIAIPERVDLVRMVGPDRQAIIRLNLRAIAEGTHPDVFIKPDDRIVVGTNFWAFPLAVVRGGFRATYGYGFVLDRNFSGEVFGN